MIQLYTSIWNFFPKRYRVTSINAETEKVNTWLKLNKLALNVDKTKNILFYKHRPITPIQFTINNSIIDVVEYFKNIGA